VRTVRKIRVSVVPYTFFILAEIADTQSKTDAHFIGVIINSNIRK
jgi:hypothetical protein